jgi:prolyl-tRNA synthetase
MAHADDTGLIIPPALAPLHVVIVPIYKTEEEKKQIMDYLQPLVERFSSTKLFFPSKYFSDGINLRWKIDDDTNKSPGWKYNEYELK